MTQSIESDARTVIAGLCDEVISAEASCFAGWCQIMDGARRPAPAAVVASQQALHRAVEDLRRVCLANPETAEAMRQDLLRMQVEGEIRAAAETKRLRTAAARDTIRRRWIAERLHTFKSRDAIAIGLGWPHRAEPVTVTAWHYRDGEEAEATGPGLYLDSYDIYNVTHQIWMPTISADHRLGTLFVTWQPRPGASQPANADPAGDIALQVKGAEARALPVPLPRWPKPEDIEGGPGPVRTTPAGAQLDLPGFAATRRGRTAATITPRPGRAQALAPGQLDLFGEEVTDRA